MEKNTLLDCELLFVPRRLTPRFVHPPVRPRRNEADDLVFLEDTDLASVWRHLFAVGRSCDGGGGCGGSGGVLGSGVVAIDFFAGTLGGTLVDRVGI